jgi:ankyrin repeat protein
LPEDSQLFIHHVKTGKGSLATYHAYIKNLDGRDSYGYTAVHWAVIKKNTGSLEWLAHHGAQLSIPCQQGVTPLHLAISQKDEALIDFLIQLKAEIFITSQTISAIEHLIQAQNLGILKRIKNLISNPKKLIERKSSIETLLQKQPLSFQEDCRKILDPLFDQEAPVGTETKKILSFGGFSSKGGASKN